MKYPVENTERGWIGWYSYEQLKYMATLMDEEGDYQPDSPEADFITGYNTDTYADESIAIMDSIWDDYLDDCADEDSEPDWQEYLDRVCANYDWLLCHTWLRVTNLHNEDDADVDKFGRDCASGTMEARLQ